MIYMSWLVYLETAISKYLNNDDFKYFSPPYYPNMMCYTKSIIYISERLKQ